MSKTPKTISSTISARVAFIILVLPVILATLAQAQDMQKDTRPVSPPDVSGPGFGEEPGEAYPLQGLMIFLKAMEAGKEIERIDRQKSPEQPWRPPGTIWSPDGRP